MSEERSLRLNGDVFENQTPYEAAQIEKICNRKDVLEFFSIKSQSWRPIAGFIGDFIDGPPRLQQMKEAGIKRVKILGVGDGSECRICRRLTEKTFPIDQAPEVPPRGCKCRPWNRCVIIAMASGE